MENKSRTVSWSVVCKAGQPNSALLASDPNRTVQSPADILTKLQSWKYYLLCCKNENRKFISYQRKNYEPLKRLKNLPYFHIYSSTLYEPTAISWKSNKNVPQIKHIVFYRFFITQFEKWISKECNFVNRDEQPKKKKKNSYHWLCFLHWNTNAF